MAIDILKETKRRLARTRRRRLMLRPSERDGRNPILHHDVLVIPPPDIINDDEFFRLPVVKSEQANQGQAEDIDARKGIYVDPPELLDSYDYAQRKVLSASRPQDWGPREWIAKARGIAFGTLPVKAEPAATSCGACYLVDAQNLRFSNAWTAEEWNAVDGVPDLPSDATASLPKFEVLIAGPRGKVFYLRVNLAREGDGSDLWPAGGPPVDLGGARGDIECLDLRYETEIWNQLRNGAVAGRVLIRKKARTARPELRATISTTPLVNITSLVPDDDLGEPSNGIHYESNESSQVKNGNGNGKEGKR
jgi:hypothetical protein